MQTIAAALITGMLSASIAESAGSPSSCSKRSVVAKADVSVSDGSGFAVETFYHAKDAAAIKHIFESEQWIVVEGPQSWVEVGGEAKPGADFHKLFALGHQFHAFVLYFDEIVSNVRETDDLPFGDGTYRAYSGDYPYGGVVHLVRGETDANSRGLIFEFPEDTTIVVGFDDWRDVNGESLPFELRIDDGEQVFDYSYTSIYTEPQSPSWFLDAVDEPDIDSVREYRNELRRLASRCSAGDEMQSGSASLIGEG